MLSSTSPFRFAGSGETSTSSIPQRQPEDIGPEKDSDKPEISLSWVRKQIRGLPKGVNNLCIPRKALEQDILELSRTAVSTDKTALKIRDSKIELLARHSDDRYGENDRLLQQSLIQANYPVFERLLKALDKPNLAPVIEVAALTNNRDAFEKILEKAARTKSEVPESTLRFVADCGQVDLLRKLFSNSFSALPTAQKKTLWKTAIESRNFIDEMRGHSQADRQEWFNDLILSNEESEFAIPEDERGPVAQALIRSGLEWGPDAKRQALSRGIALNYADLVKSLIYIHGDLTPLDKQALLEQAMTDKANPDILRLLIGAGADVNEKNVWGFTPLHKAAYIGQSEFGKTVIDAGADVNEKDIWGRMPLHQAVANGSVQFVKMLIEAGANVNAKDNDGGAPLHHAATANRPAFGKMLIDNDADLNIENNEGKTPLDLAIQEGHTEFADILRQKMADANNPQEPDK